MYALLRAVAGLALRWYYSDIQVIGADRIPQRRPILLVVNHPNALVDALLIGWVMPRRVLITAKATLFANPLAGSLLRRLGVVPLRRSSDELAGTEAGSALDAARNNQTFEAVHDALRVGGCVLIFPEGRSLDEPALLPLKTGAARMALHSQDTGEAHGLTILPIGLAFEQKETPRSRVLVTVGEPIDVTEWVATNASEPRRVERLTDDIATRLRAVTLNYGSLDDAARARRFAALTAAILEDAPPIDVIDRRYGAEATIARRVQFLSTRLPFASAELKSRADEVVRRIGEIETLTSQYGLPLEDVRIELTALPATRFVAREAWFVLVAGPIAFWGWLNHWLPIRASRAVARWKIESNADPAMRTIIAGTAFILLAYVAQALIVGTIFGWLIATFYLVSLPIAAEVNFAFTDRWRRVRRRARAFFIFRRHHDFHDRLAMELGASRRDVEALDRDLAAVTPPRLDQ